MSKSNAAPSVPAAVKEPLPKPTAFESIRETFDSIAIAFILAFLFRSFQAEAFVIPTGSMALTLMGAHKEVNCPQCAYEYKVGASSPDDGPPRHISSSICPNCRFQDRFADGNPPTFNGDRILVTKFPYEFADPKRFDVAVFKNPGEAKQNYIKRVMGLPSEEVMIYRGDIYARGKNETKFSIQRKPPEKVLATAQTVYDNDHVLESIIKLGWPHRWSATQLQENIAPAAAPPADGAIWQTSADLKSFHAVGKSPTEMWLRYRHIVPDDRSWSAMRETPLLGAKQPLQPTHVLTEEERQRFCVPQLITDFCEYNTGDNDFTYAGLHWVGDLILECALEFGDRSGDDAEAILELVEGGKSFQCRIKPASGDIELRIDGVPDFHPTAKGKVVGKGPHKLRFSNADDRLLVWVDDDVVEFDASTNFLGVGSAPVYHHAVDENRRTVTVIDRHQLDGGTNIPALEINVPTEQDLRSPVGIAVRGVDAVVSKLHLKRDLYSIADSGLDGSPDFPRWSVFTNRSTVTDYRADVFQPFTSSGLTEFRSHPETLRAFMSDVKTLPERWNQLSATTFQLEADQFFVLGDNSAKSLDGRLWNGPKQDGSPGFEPYVKRELLIGKALFVYWPHGLERIPGTSIRLPSLPYFERQYGPNFSDMRLIR